jgi:hypothetical protein
MSPEMEKLAGQVFGEFWEYGEDLSAPCIDAFCARIAEPGHSLRGAIRDACRLAWLAGWEAALMRPDPPDEGG